MGLCIQLISVTEDPSSVAMFLQVPMGIFDWCGDAHAKLVRDGLRKESATGVGLGRV